jgi:hypothetical protein
MTRFKLLEKLAILAVTVTGVGFGVGFKVGEAAAAVIAVGFGLF